MKSHWSKFSRSYMLCLFLSAISAAVLTACSQDDEHDNTSGKVVEGKVKVAINLLGIAEGGQESIAKSTQTSEIINNELGGDLSVEYCLTPDHSKTRSTTAMEAGRKYRVVFYKGTNTTPEEDVVFTAGSGTESVLLDAGDEYKYVAYSYNSSADITDDISSGIIPVSQTDILYSAAQTFTPSSTDANTLNIAFQHLFSQVTVEINSLTLGINRKVMAVAGAGIDVSHKPNALNLLTGSVEAASGGDMPLTFTTDTQRATSNTVYVIAGSSTITFKLTGATISAATYGTSTVAESNLSLSPITFTKPETFTAGTKYTLTARLIRSVTVAGLKWLKGNLHSSGVFLTQEYYSGAAGGGDLWGYGQDTPYNYGYSTVKTNWSPDPCKNMLGSAGDWRLPSKSEFETLVAGDQVHGTKNSISGLFFGTITEPSTEVDKDKYLFLPEAGYRDASYSNYYAGYGRYWTSNCLPNLVSYFSASFYFLNWYPGILPTQILTSNQRLGAAIRCVRDL